MNEVLLKHFDLMLTALGPILIAAIAARIKVQGKYVREVVEKTESESATSTNPEIDNHIKHEHAAKLMRTLPIHVRPLLGVETNALIKSSVNRGHRWCQRSRNREHACHSATCESPKRRTQERPNSPQGHT
jgi:Tfp pilus assembly major pilin PilA